MTSEAIVCPRDGAALRSEEYEGVTVDVCPVCRGCWLDRGELEVIQETRGSSADDQGEPSPTEMAEQRDRASIACVRCGTTMETREHGFASQVLVDSCVEGCGMWLDEGELAALERFFDDNRDNETLPLHWRLWARVASALRR